MRVGIEIQFRDGLAYTRGGAGLYFGELIVRETVAVEPRAPLATSLIFMQHHAVESGRKNSF